MTAKLETFTGPEIYVDTSIFLFVALAHPVHGRKCVDFFRRSQSGEFSLVTCSLTLDEFLFIALAQRLEQEHGVSKSKARFLRNHPEVVQELSSSVVPLTENIVVLSRVEPVSIADAVEMGGLVKAHGLLPRDAIHMAVMKRLGLAAVATDDTDYARVPGIQVYLP